MPNMSPNKVKMPEQDPNVRNKNFEEVSLGYTKEQAMEEATRCLNCKKPFCMDGCPVGVPIPEFIHHVAEGEFEEAYQTITRENALPAICGRVCPQENQCEGKCVRGIKTESVGIGRLERFVRISDGTTKLHNLWLFQFDEHGSIKGNPHKLSDAVTAINDLMTIDVPLVVSENQTLYLLVLGPKLNYDMSGVSTLDELKNWSFDYLINVEGHTQSLITADDEVPLAGEVSGVTVVDIDGGKRGLVEYNMPGGMISVVVKGDEGYAERIISKLRWFTLAESLGGVESLVSQPFSMTHASIPLEKRLANGITPQLIRLSVGIEDPNDLIADWQQALRAE